LLIKFSSQEASYGLVGKEDMGLPHSSEVVRRASPILDLLTGMCMVMFVNTYLTSQSCSTLHFTMTDG